MSFCEKSFSIKILSPLNDFILSLKTFVLTLKDDGLSLTNSFKLEALMSLSRDFLKSKFSDNLFLNESALTVILS